MQNYSNVFRRKAAARDGEKGFTVLELLTAMIIFLIVTGTIFGVMQVAQRSRSVVSQKVQLTKNVRLALNLIGRDTYNAGFAYPLRNSVLLPDNRISTRLGIPNDIDTTRDTVPPIIAGNNITLNTHNTSPNVRTDQVTFLFKDSTFNLINTGDSEVSQPLNVAAATTNGSGIDEIVPVSGGTNAPVNVNDIFLIRGETGSALGVVTGLSGTNIIQFANGDALGFNLSGPTGELIKVTAPASMQRVRMVTYFVTADGTLTRKEFANAAPVVPAVDSVDAPLVYGVENFQIQYVMESGALSDNPSAGPNNVPGDADDRQADLAAIRQIRFTVSVRSNETNAAGQPYRTTMTSTFSTRNLGYDAN